MTYSRAFSATAFGMLLMCFESPLVKITHVSGENFTFYYGLSIFFATHLFLWLRYKKEMISFYLKHPKNIFFSMLCLGFSNLFFVLAIKHTSVASAVFILSTGPLIGALLNFIVFKKRTPTRTFVAFFVVLIGISIILFNDLELGNTKGNLYAFGSIFAFVSFLTLLDYNKDVNRLVCFGSGALMASFFSLLSATIVIPDAHSLGVILFTGLILTPISRAFMGIGTKVLPSVEVALLMIIEPVLAPIWVWIFLKEVPHGNTLIGGAIILTSLAVHSLVAYKETKTVKP